MKIGIIVGSTRPGRKALHVAQWVQENAKDRDHEYVIIDIADANLPMLDESRPPAMGEPEHEHTRAWAQTIAACDSFIIVTPEYNHSMPAALKNALDYLWAEWGNKAVGFVSYGAAMGFRAVEHLRLVAVNFRMADVRAQVGLSLFTDFAAEGTVADSPSKVKELGGVLDEVEAWGNALATLRS